MTRLLLILTAVVLFSLNFSGIDLNNSAYYTPPYDQKEKFDPAMVEINSIRKLVEYIDQQALQQGINPQSVAYVTLTENSISKRFYHGFSHLTFNENWAAAIAEKVFGHGLSCKVDPASIMKHGNAACSQQCIVMMEVLKTKNIPYRKVGFPHHYAIEASIDNSWYFFDPNMEPTITSEERKEQNWKCCGDNLKKYYDKSRFRDLDYKFGKDLMVTVGAVNETPAKNARMFQKATAIFSKTAWILPLFLLQFSKAPARRKKPLASLFRLPFAQWLRNRFALRPTG